MKPKTMDVHLAQAINCNYEYILLPAFCAGYIRAIPKPQKRVRHALHKKQTVFTGVEIDVPSFETGVYQNGLKPETRDVHLALEMNCNFEYLSLPKLFLFLHRKRRPSLVSRLGIGNHLVTRY